MRKHKQEEDTKFNVVRPNSAWGENRERYTIKHRVQESNHTSQPFFPKYKHKY